MGPLVIKALSRTRKTSLGVDGIGYVYESGNRRLALAAGSRICQSDHTLKVLCLRKQVKWLDFLNLVSPIGQNSEVAHLSSRIARDIDDFLWSESDELI